MHTFEEFDNIECLQARKTRLFHTNRDDAVQYEYVSVCIKTSAHGHGIALLYKVRTIYYTFL